MIWVHDLQKEFVGEGESIKALQGITFTIQKGEFVSIMGPSGSGKSTLLNILSFLDRPTGGEYTFMGKSIDQLSDKELAHIRNKEMGFIFQSFNLLSRSSVYENIEIPLLYSSDISPGSRPALVKQAVDSVGLSEKLYVEAGKLSGGQKQRVAIARALVNNPHIIFADEPTGNLDSKSGASVMAILKKLNAAGHTIILVTHETYTAQFASRLITIKDGLLETDQAIKKDDKGKFFK